MSNIRIKSGVRTVLGPTEVIVHLTVHKEQRSIEGYGKVMSVRVKIGGLGTETEMVLKRQRL